MLLLLLQHSYHPFPREENNSQNLIWLLTENLIRAPNQNPSQIRFLKFLHLLFPILYLIPLQRRLFHLSQHQSLMLHSQNSPLILPMKLHPNPPQILPANWQSGYSLLHFHRHQEKIPLPMHCSPFHFVQILRDPQNPAQTLLLILSQNSVHSQTEADHLSPSQTPVHSRAVAALLFPSQVPAPSPTVAALLLPLQVPAQPQTAAAPVPL